MFVLASVKESWADGRGGRATRRARSNMSINCGKENILPFRGEVRSFAAPPFPSSFLPLLAMREPAGEEAGGVWETDTRAEKLRVVRRRRYSDLHP